MNNLFRSFLILGVLAILSCHVPSSSTTAPDPSLTLWYDQPAENWTEALPIGNGRLGAMIYGKIDQEIIQFNEETLWTGQPNDYAHEQAHEVLDELRRLLWAGRQEEAHQLANERFMSKPFRQLSYQPFGHILLEFPARGDAINFRRSLDLENAVASVQYEVGDVVYQRQMFASEPAQTMITKLEASRKGALSFSIGLDSPHAKYEVQAEGNELILSGRANDYPKEVGRDGTPFPKSELTFEARLKLKIDGGEMMQEGNKLKVKNATSAVLQLVAATSFVNYGDISADPAGRCRNDLEKLEGRSYEELKEEHSADYRGLFSRVSLDLGKSNISGRPTDERLLSFQDDQDPSLIALLYQYGRYLLIASSRPGTQPANLQGIWNDELSPPWDSKYTININTEMNYWPAEITNLSELTAPLINMVEELAVTGQRVAKAHYDLDGWVAHHNTDQWRGAAPINNSNHGIWVTGGAWLCQHLWWHYQFTGDVDYLRNRAYPILKQASIFFADYLVPDPAHPEWLVSGPSNSPENGGLVMAPTMDHQIIRNLFANTIEAAEILDTDREFAEMLRTKRAKIAPNRIGQHGQLQEWLVDQDDPENQHRHVSHLWGLHPGNEIHPTINPDLAEACKVTLAHRGDGGTGWSLAWKINFWARLLDGDHSFRLLRNFMSPAIPRDGNQPSRGGLYPNLFDAHPPFQIDGNFGATSGITEMLLQSHLRDENGDYFQDILPALPPELPTGNISGIVGRGCFEVAIAWKDGRLDQVEIISQQGNKLNVRYQGKLVSRETTKGEKLTFELADFQ